jgi:hypothetical protein
LPKQSPLQAICMQRKGELAHKKKPAAKQAF